MSAFSSSRALAFKGDAPSEAPRPRHGATAPIRARVGIKRPTPPIKAVEKAPTIATLFALAQNHRLDVFQMIVQAGAEGVPAGQIRHRLGLRKSLISFHLKQLRIAGLVTVRREGRSFIYAARESAVNRLMAFLSESCSQAGPPAAMPATSS